MGMLRVAAKQTKNEIDVKTSFTRQSGVSSL